MTNANSEPNSINPLTDYSVESGYDSPLHVGPLTFQSRLVIGTGKYPDFETMQKCHEACGADLVTVALRRIDLAAHRRGEPTLLDFIDQKRFTLLPNTAACFNAKDAIQVCHVARELGIGAVVKVEVLADEKTLLPDPFETLVACKELVADGFIVMAYCGDDPVVARRLGEAGVHAVMPLGSPIGSGLGILNPNNIRIILEEAQVPIVVDAGVGCASDVAIAMELGVDGVLLNTAVAHAQDPVKMALAVRHACLAGRFSYLAGRMPKRAYANASSPPMDFLARK
jgi:thiazole synthase